MVRGIQTPIERKRVVSEYLCESASFQGREYVKTRRSRLGFGVRRRVSPLIGPAGRLGLVQPLPRRFSCQHATKRRSFASAADEGCVSDTSSDEGCVSDTLNSCWTHRNRAYSVTARDTSAPRGVSLLLARPGGRLGLVQPLIT